MTRARAGSVPLTGLLRAWLTIWVLIWPTLLIVAFDWAFGPQSTATSVAFLIAVAWALWRYWGVQKRIHTVRVKTPRRRRARR
jgi:hypothetical protein